MEYDGVEVKEVQEKIFVQHLGHCHHHQLLYHSRPEVGVMAPFSFSVIYEK
jgi:hypothetical protein